MTNAEIKENMRAAIKLAIADELLRSPNERQAHAAQDFGNILDRVLTHVIDSMTKESYIPLFHLPTAKQPA